MPRIRAPSRRECTRCGRRERWDDDAGHWRIGDSEGDVYCVHAWDVTGSFSAVEEDESDEEHEG